LKANGTAASRQRQLLVGDVQVGRLHGQAPVLKVVVEVEALLQHHLLVDPQQAGGQLGRRLVRPEGAVELADVRGHVLQGRLPEDGAVVAQVGGLPAVQVDLGVVGLGPAGQFGAQLRQLPVRAVDELGAVVRLEPHGGVGAAAGADGPRLVVDAGGVVVLEPPGRGVELAP